MPTGYTADIKDGIDFKTYAMNCARAFGACVTLRDEPGGGEHIPETFEPSDYHIKALDKARDELAALYAMTPAELDQTADKDYNDAETHRAMRLREIAEQRAAYRAMLKQVNAWEPPTDDHKSFKQFMATQIIESVRFDCDDSYYSTPTKRATGEEWATKRRADLERDVAYHQKEHAEEVARAKQRTEWIKALRGAIGGSYD